MRHLHEWGSVSDEWRIRADESSMFARTFYAVAPGCPFSPHGIRDCACRAFRSPRQAEAHIANEKIQAIL